ncbi:hypothetical protein TNCT_723461 [Trichonephila clavata]|uniref:Uncharacterized protein n=1 Tax=Trichonephila clavata TaxID=2740835 RepID=A0A8X6HEJ8_TRICU|nr:hypothetical protein TNCT_723461 [Trichonephila clavata]
MPQDCQHANCFNGQLIEMYVIILPKANNSATTLHGTSLILDNTSGFAKQPIDTHPRRIATKPDTKSLSLTMVHNLVSLTSPSMMST